MYTIWTILAFMDKISQMSTFTLLSLPSPWTYTGDLSVFTDVSWQGPKVHTTRLMMYLQDVSKAVLFSRRHSLPLSVRSGGHSYICQSIKVPSHVFSVTFIPDLINRWSCFPLWVVIDFPSISRSLVTCDGSDIIYWKIKTTFLTMDIRSRLRV